MILLLATLLPSQSSSSSTKCGRKGRVGPALGCLPKTKTYFFHPDDRELCQTFMDLFHWCGVVQQFENRPFDQSKLVVGIWSIVCPKCFFDFEFAIGNHHYHVVGAICNCNFGVVTGGATNSNNTKNRLEFFFKNSLCVRDVSWLGDVTWLVDNVVIEFLRVSPHICENMWSDA